MKEFPRGEHVAHNPISKGADNLKRLRNSAYERMRLATGGHEAGHCIVGLKTAYSGLIEDDPGTLQNCNRVGGAQVDAHPHMVPCVQASQNHGIALVCLKAAHLRAFAS